jgi:hypothetical protein
LQTAPPGDDGGADASSRGGAKDELDGCELVAVVGTLPPCRECQSHQYQDQW